MKEKLAAMLEAAKAELVTVENSKVLQDLKVKYFGKKGQMTAIMKEMGKLSKEERPKIGQLANEVRAEVEALINDKMAEIKRLELEAKLKSEAIDVTLPANNFNRGGLHPSTITLKQLIDIFIGMGYTVAEGPEIETVKHNFDDLNSPIDHPSRSESDTFYFNSELLLRTHTSPVQIRTMLNNQPPIKIISPGRAFRKDEIDATHSPMFHQIEGLVVGKNVTMTDLKGTLNQFVKILFGEQIKTKFRPHYFPFTEPSAEMDVSCYKCQGEGCKFCGNSGWIEILGCGMVHPQVLKNCGIDPEIYSGFAFGMGLDRLTLLKYEIADIRLLFENDVRFLAQF